MMALALTAPTEARAEKQPFTANNSIYAEGLGPGLAYSLNYERIVENVIGIRAGVSYLSLSASAGAGGATASASSSWFSLPLTVSYLGIRSGNHALELGAGATMVYTSGAVDSLGTSASGSGVAGYGTAMIGYRRQPANGGFQFRVGLATLFGPGLSLSNAKPGTWGAIPWGYISLGAAF